MADFGLLMRANSMQRATIKGPRAKKSAGVAAQHKRGAAGGPAVTTATIPLQSSLAATS